MEVINDRVSMLTNHEVLVLLKESMNEQLSKEKEFRIKSLKHVSNTAIKYLKTTPAVNQNDEVISDVIKKLTAAETMQIINLRPSTASEIQLIVEESEERFKTEEKINNLVDIITCTLPPKSS